MRREPAEIRRSGLVARLIADHSPRGRRGDRQVFDLAVRGGLARAPVRARATPRGGQTRPASRVIAPLSVKRETKIDLRRKGGAGPSGRAGGGMGA